MELSLPIALAEATATAFPERGFAWNADLLGDDTSSYWSRHVLDIHAADEHPIARWLVESGAWPDGAEAASVVALRLEPGAVVNGIVPPDATRRVLVAIHVPEGASLTVDRDGAAVPVVTADAIALDPGMPYTIRTAIPFMVKSVCVLAIDFA